MDPALVVRILQIVEREEESDDRRRREMQLESLTSPGTPSEDTKSLSRKPQRSVAAFKNYKKNLLEKMENAVEEKFQDALAEQKSMKGKLEALSTIFEDDVATRIPDNVVPCFPPHY